VVLLKRIDRYLLRFFFLALLVVTVAIGFTIVIINMIEQLRNFIDKAVPLFTIIEYYVYFAGWVVRTFFPMFVLLASLFSVALLARKNEVMAMKAAGLSLYRIAAPLLIVGLLLSVGHFYYNEYIYPPANKKRVEMKEFDIKKRSKRTYQKVSNIYRQVRPGYFYTIGNFNIVRQEGINIKVYRAEENRVQEIVAAEKLIYDNFKWVAIDGIRRTFAKDGLEKSFNQFDSMIVDDIQETPEQFARRLGKPEDASLEELQAYIDLMKRTGGPYHREMIDLKMKYAYPLASFVVILIAVPFASSPKRGSIAVSFAAGILIALVYFVTFKIMHSAGYNEKVPDFIAVWGINTVFFIIGLIVMFIARK